jgi:hypothetical protein
VYDDSEFQEKSSHGFAANYHLRDHWSLQVIFCSKKASFLKGVNLRNYRSKNVSSKNGFMRIVAEKTVAENIFSKKCFSH